MPARQAASSNPATSTTNDIVEAVAAAAPVIREAVSSGRLRLSKLDPSLPRLVAELTGLDESLVRRNWDLVYRLVLLAVKGRLAPRATRTGVSVTVATAVYWALWVDKGVEAPLAAYQLFEPLTEDPRFARLAFSPVTGETLDEQVRLACRLASLARLSRRARLVLLDTLCLVTSFLSSTEASRCRGVASRCLGLS